MNTQYEDALRALENTADGLGLGIDPGIRHAVAACNAIGLITNGSCEGHLDRGLPYPWIGFGETGTSDDMHEPPKFLENFVYDMHGLVDKYSKSMNFGLNAYAVKDGMRYTIVSDSDGHQRLYADDTSVNTKDKNQLTNLKQAKQLLKLLDEYYAQHPTPYSQMLSIDFFGDYTFRLQPICDSLLIQAPASNYKHIQQDWLKRMNSFADFALSTLK